MAPPRTPSAHTYIRDAQSVPGAGHDEHFTRTGEPARLVVLAECLLDLLPDGIPGWFIETGEHLV